MQRIDANRGDGPVIIDHYAILGHPTLLLSDREGAEIKRLLGPQTTETLEKMLDSFLAAE